MPEYPVSLSAEVAVSVSPETYEVDESAGVVRITVQKSGVFSSPISGTLTTTSGTAGDKKETVHIF